MSRSPRQVQVGVRTLAVVLLSGLATYLLIWGILSDDARTFGMMMTFGIELLLALVFGIIWYSSTKKEGK